MLCVLNFIPDRRSSKNCMCTVSFFKCLRTTSLHVLTRSYKTAWEDLYRLSPCIIRTPLLQLKSVGIYVSVYNPHPDLTQMSLHTN